MARRPHPRSQARLRSGGDVGGAIEPRARTGCLQGDGTAIHFAALTLRTLHNTTTTPPLPPKNCYEVLCLPRPRSPRPEFSRPRPLFPLQLNPGTRLNSASEAHAPGLLTCRGPNITSASPFICPLLCLAFFSPHAVSERRPCMCRHKHQCTHLPS